MRSVDPKLWLCLAFALVACELVVDFPKHKLQDAGTQLDAMVGKDAARDTSVGTRDVGPEGGGGDGSTPPAGPCSLTNSSGCDSDQLCCDRQDGNGPTCFATSGVGDCTACGAACADPAAPNCGGRICECTPGSGEGCQTGQLCVGSGTTAHCAECAADADCAARTDGKLQCVNSACVQCDQGPLVNDASDDQGCPATTPICGSNNQCGGCTASPNNCPTAMVCNPGLGCSGCRLNAVVGQNGCGGTLPVCDNIMISGMTVAQCRQCKADGDCGGGYCIESTGECVNGCDPEELPGENHCTPVTPICKDGATGYSCVTCSVPADCVGVAQTPHCATTGTLAGECVQCRNNGDCDQASATPVCGLSGSCRARTATDCTGMTPQFEPTSKTCVQCLPASQVTDCASTTGHLCTGNFTCGECSATVPCTNPARPICSANNTCTSGCTLDKECNPVQSLHTLYCDAANGGVCVVCVNDSHCAFNTTPFCSPSSNTCVPCTSASAETRDTMCANKAVTTPICVTTGANVGTCAQCDVGSDGTSTGCLNNGTNNYCAASTNTCQACDPVTNAGCSGQTPICVSVSNVTPTTYACNECDPGKPSGVNGCLTGVACLMTRKCDTSGGAPGMSDGGM